MFKVPDLKSVHIGKVVTLGGRRKKTSQGQEQNKINVMPRGLMFHAFEISLNP